MGYARARMSFVTLGQLFKAELPHDFCSDAPADLRVVNVWVENGYSRGYFWVCLESDEYQEKEPGAMLPEIEIVFHQRGEEEDG